MQNNLEITLTHAEQIAILKTEVKTLKDAHEEINRKLDILVDNMNKSKGFWAGVVAAGTATGAMIGALVSYIFTHKLSG